MEKTKSWPIETEIYADTAEIEFLNVFDSSQIRERLLAFDFVLDDRVVSKDEDYIKIEILYLRTR